MRGMREERIVPVYVITGFLESGKTRLIQSMFTDEGFSQGQKTLILCCEDGMEEYEEADLKANNAELVML